MAVVPDKRMRAGMWLAPTRRRWMGGAVALVLLAWGWHAWTGAAPTTGQLDRAGHAVSWLGATSATDQADPAQARRFQTGVEDLPASLRGTEVDGELTVDAHGHLRVLHGVRQFFDYFLTLAGEEPVPQIRARLAAYIKARLPAPARDEAFALLGRYLAYRDAELSLGQTSGQMAVPADALQARLGQLQTLRQSYFSAAEHAAFFGDEEALAQVSVASLRIMRDATLNAGEKAARLHQLNATLPAELQAAVSAQARYAQLSAITQALRAEGADAAALHQARVEVVGVEATVRLEALDAQRARWQSRLDDFQRHRASLMGDPSLSESQRQAAVSQLATQSFSATEWTRAQALLGAGSTAPQ